MRAAPRADRRSRGDWWAHRILDPRGRPAADRRRYSTAFALGSEDQRMGRVVLGPEALGAEGGRDETGFAEERHGLEPVQRTEALGHFVFFGQATLPQLVRDGPLRELGDAFEHGQHLAALGDEE